jgi:hypothetical protein
VIGAPIFSFGNEKVTESKDSQKIKTHVNVQIMFEYFKMDPKIEVWKVPTSLILDVGSNKTIPIGSPLPFTEKLDSEFSVKRNNDFFFAMVIKNQSDDTKYFYASYHQMRPEEAAIGYSMYCLCINKVFSIPPRSIFYRIGKVRIDSAFIGTTVAFKHDIFGLTRDDIANKKLEGLFQE